MRWLFCLILLMRGATDLYHPLLSFIYIYLLFTDASRVEEVMSSGKNGFRGLLRNDMHD